VENSAESSAAVAAASENTAVVVVAVAAVVAAAGSNAVAVGGRLVSAVLAAGCMSTLPAAVGPRSPGPPRAATGETRVGSPDRAMLTTPGQGADSIIRRWGLMIQLLDGLNRKRASISKDVVVEETLKGVADTQKSQDDNQHQCPSPDES
jgi:hypothetical protein